MDNLTVEKCYEILKITTEATLEDIETNYYKLVGEKLKTHNKQDLVDLKQAHSKLIEHYHHNQEKKEHKENKRYLNFLEKSINQQLKNLGIKVKVESHLNNLHITFNDIKLTKKLIITKLIYDILNQILKDSETSVFIFSVDYNKNIIWQEKITICTGIYAYKAHQYNTDILLKEAEINTNTYALPFAFLIAFVVSFIDPLLWFISMWIHEFGHATIAWLSGYNAMITFAGTVIGINRSLFVYFGLLIIISLTYYFSWKEGKKNIMIFCIFLAIFQFILTWNISYSTYEMLLYFGGIGGEFYLSTLLIITFYWRLPKKFYWEFWRFFALLIGTITFWGSFTKWQRILLGKEQIPLGTFWGGRGDSGGDLNVLNDIGWSINQIIDTYNTLGFICLLVIVSTYLYYLWKSNAIFRLKINHYFFKHK